MEIQVKLYGGLSQYAPGQQTNYTQALPSSATIKDFLTGLSIPENTPYTILMNGRRVDQSTLIQKASTLVLMPEISGG